MTIKEENCIKRITQLRLQKDVSARDMSLSLGQSQSYINKIENHKSIPSLSVLFNICECFDVTEIEFFDYKNKYPHEMRELLNKFYKLDNRQVRYFTEMLNDVIKNYK